MTKTANVFLSSLAGRRVIKTAMWTCSMKLSLEVGSSAEPLGLRRSGSPRMFQLMMSQLCTRASGAQQLPTPIWTAIGLPPCPMYLELALFNKLPATLSPLSSSVFCVMQHEPLVYLDKLPGNRVAYSSGPWS